MRWDVIAWLQVLGLGYAWAAAQGTTSGPEWAWWLGITIISGWAIARWVRRDHFMHGFWAGLSMAVVATLVQWLMHSTGATWTWSASWTWMIPVMWLVLAVWMGAMSWLIGRFMGRPAAATA